MDAVEAALDGVLQGDRDAAAAGLVLVGLACLGLLFVAQELVRSLMRRAARRRSDRRRAAAIQQRERVARSAPADLDATRPLPRLSDATVVQYVVHPVDPPRRPRRGVHRA